MRSGFWKADWFPGGTIAIDQPSIDDLGRQQGWYASLTVRSPRTRWT